MKALALVLLSGCAAARPSLAEEARFAGYADALKACNVKLAADVEEAKAKGNASRSVLLASYETCAHAVDVAWGRAK